MGRSILGYTICTVSVLALPASAWAGLKKDTPKEVCAYLEKEGFQTSEFKRLSKGLYFASAMKKVGAGESPNTLEYNVEGDQPTRVTKVYLNLNIDDPAGAQAGHAALLTAGGVLVEKATGKKM